MKIETFRSPANGQFYFRVRARNNRVILQSEGYKRRGSMNRTIDLIVLKMNGAVLVHR